MFYLYPSISLNPPTYTLFKNIHSTKYLLPKSFFLLISTLQHVFAPHSPSWRTGNVLRCIFCISNAFTTHLIPRQEFEILLPIWLIVSDDKLDQAFRQSMMHTRHHCCVIQHFATYHHNFLLVFGPRVIHLMAKPNGNAKGKLGVRGKIRTEKNPLCCKLLYFQHLIHSVMLSNKNQQY